MNVCALIPAYNEAATIARVVRGCAPHVAEVLVVDDGSGDDTARLAEDAGATVIIHKRNAGKGAAIRTGFTCVRGGDFDAVDSDADWRVAKEARAGGTTFVYDMGTGESGDNDISRLTVQVLQLGFRQLAQGGGASQLLEQGGSRHLGFSPSPFRRPRAARSQLITQTTLHRQVNCGWMEPVTSPHFTPGREAIGPRWRGELPVESNQGFALVSAGPKTATLTALPPAPPRPAHRGSRSGGTRH